MMRRRLTRIHLLASACAVGLALPAAAQSTTASRASRRTVSSAAVPSPPPINQAAPSAQAAPAPPAAATGPLGEEGFGSLFAPRWNMFQLAGRVSSIDGDAARYQRYEDLRDGLLFTGAKFQRSPRNSKPRA